MSLTAPINMPPLENLLAQAHPRIQAAVTRTYARMVNYAAVGMPRKEICAVLHCGSTAERAKERSGAIATWTDGVHVYGDPASVFLHAIELMIASNPVDGPRRQGRKPPNPYRKVRTSPRSERELAALKAANDRRHSEALERKAGKHASAP
jgi:hypothetical protein